MFHTITVSHSDKIKVFFVLNQLQLVSEYTGYDNTKDPTDLQFSGCAERVFALKYHPEYDDIFLTGGWDRQIKVALRISLMHNNYNIISGFCRKGCN